MHIFIDIETIKTDNQAIIDDIAEGVTHPGNIKKAESIEAWNKDKKPQAVADAVAKTSFDGGAGQIIAFSCAVDDGEILSLWRNKDKSEADLLNEINEVLSKSLLYSGQNSKVVRPATWVAHNGTGFDFRFLWKRFIVNNIRPCVKIPYDAKPWSNDVYDTMTEWGGFGSDRKSMDFVCKALGIEGKGDMDGSKVGAAWEAGEYDKIGLYCGDDVDKLRQIWKRMTFK